MEPVAVEGGDWMSAGVGFSRTQTMRELGPLFPHAHWMPKFFTKACMAAEDVATRGIEAAAMLENDATGA